MKVTVSVLAYNHESYIAQAIESVLMQKTDFDYEILIGEDGSSDRTRSIVLDYEKRFPDKVRVLLNDREEVIYVDGKPTGRWNFINNMSNSKGEFVALLDGDDYWISPYKLQKQVDFLEANPQCALCFHSIQMVWADKSRNPSLVEPNIKKKYYSIEDLLLDNFIYTVSVMFRNKLFGSLPEWFKSVGLADWSLHLLNAQHGKIGYLDSAMGAYRIHSGGTWQVRESVNRIECSIQSLQCFNLHSGKKYDGVIRGAIHRYSCTLALRYAKAGDERQARNHLKACVNNKQDNIYVSRLELLYIRLCVAMPWLEKYTFEPLKRLKLFVARFMA